MGGESLINKALAKAQGEYKKVVATREVHTPNFTYKYASLDDCFDGTREALVVNGILITQSAHITGTPEMPLIEVETCLTASDGSFVTGHAMVPVPQPTTNKFGKVIPVGAQDFGSALTYARRYSFVLAAGLAVGDEDTDGPAQGHFERQEEPTPAPPPPLRASNALALEIGKLAQEKGYIVVGPNGQRDPKRLIDLVTVLVPHILFPEEERRPGHMVNWSALTEQDFLKLKNKILRPVEENPASFPDDPPEDVMYST